MRPPVTYAPPMTYLHRCWLTKDLEDALKARATADGRDLSEVTRDALRAFLSPTKEPTR